MVKDVVIGMILYRIVWNIFCYLVDHLCKRVREDVQKTPDDYPEWIQEAFGVKKEEKEVTIIKGFKQ